MSIYLFFNGNCREVFEFYRGVFGGEFASITTFREGPDDMQVTEEELDTVMHVSLPVGSGFLMGSDVPASFRPPPAIGDNFAISIEPSNVEEMESQFAKLSDDGKVTMPLEKMFWGAYHGSCTDKFGINWQFNFSMEE